jgi:hypothetical protein
MLSVIDYRREESDGQDRYLQNVDPRPFAAFQKHD